MAQGGPGWCLASSLILSPATLAPIAVFQPHWASLSCLFSGFCGDPVGYAESLGEDRANTWKEVESLNDRMEQSLAYWPALNSDLNGT